MTGCTVVFIELALFVRMISLHELERDEQSSIKRRENKSRDRKHDNKAICTFYMEACWISLLSCDRKRAISTTGMQSRPVCKIDLKKVYNEPLIAGKKMN